MNYQNNSWTLNGGPGIAPAGFSAATIDIGAYSGNNAEEKLPNKKITINIHEAHGGYIVEMQTNPNQVGELYIVSEERDIGQEIGKIITHKTLKENHE